MRVPSLLFAECASPGGPKGYCQALRLAAAGPTMSSAATVWHTHHAPIPSRQAAQTGGTAQGQVGQEALPPARQPPQQLGFESLLSGPPQPTQSILKICRQRWAWDCRQSLVKSETPRAPVHRAGSLHATHTLVLTGHQT